MEEWKTYKIGEIATFNDNQYRLNENWHTIFYLDTGNITDNIVCDLQTIKDHVGLPSRARRKVQDGDIIYSTVRPNQKHYGFIDKPINNLLVSTGFAVIRTDKQIADAKYLYYYLTQQEIIDFLHAIGEQAVCAYPSIKAENIGDLKLSLPPLPLQRRISSLLSSLDAKIETNRRINARLEEMAQALFRSWFIDFTPFKQQEFVEDEYGRRPKGWKVFKMKDFFPVVTGKKDANIATKDGKYKFFTCSQEPLLTTNYSFEGNAVLVAGNGDFNVKTYNGKFEAYQRTYVLIPYNPLLTGWLYYALKLKLSEITAKARGSVINFITKGNIEDCPIYAPKDFQNMKIVMVLDKIVKSIAKRKEEIENLSALRDTLLPKLMSGEIIPEEITASRATRFL